MSEKDKWPDSIRERLEQIEGENFMIRVSVRGGIDAHCVMCGDEIEGDIFTPEGVGAMCEDCWIDWVDGQ